MTKHCINKIVASFVVVFTVILFSQIFLVSATDVVEDSWVVKTSMPTGRVFCGSIAASNGLIYVIGGSTGGASSSIKINEAYNPATDTWTTKEDMPTPRSAFGMVAYQNKIYCIGGVGDFGTTIEVTGVNEIYDIVTNTWETKTSMPTARGYMCANIVNGKIYVIGGSKPINWMDLTAVPNVNEVYDIATDTWDSKTPSPTNVSFYASAVIDNKIYLITGDSGDKSLLIYDTETDIWSYGAPISTSVSGAAAGATTGELVAKRLYVIGGIGANNLVQVYDPKTNTWTTGAEMPAGRYWHSVAVLDDCLYAIGGTGPAVHVNVANEMYVPGGYNTSVLPSSLPDPSVLPEDDSWSMFDLLVTVAIVVIITVGVAVGVALVLRAKKRRN